MCQRPRCYHRASKTQVTDRSLSSVPFRETPAYILERQKKSLPPFSHGVTSSDVVLLFRAFCHSLQASVIIGLFHINCELFTTKLLKVLRLIHHLLLHSVAASVSLCTNIRQVPMHWACGITLLIV